MDLKIRYNGIAPDKVVAEIELQTNGAQGLRKAILSGWDQNEIRARQQIIEQAKALRDELNRSIEEMIDQLAGELRGRPLADRIAFSRS